MRLQLRAVLAGSSQAKEVFIAGAPCSSLLVHTGSGTFFWLPRRLLAVVPLRDCALGLFLFLRREKRHLRGDLVEAGSGQVVSVSRSFGSLGLSCPWSLGLGALSRYQCL